MKTNCKYFFIFSVFFILTALDQFIKHKIRSMGGFYVCNQNLAFGLNFLSLMPAFVSILIIALIGVNFEKSKFKFEILSLRNLKLFRISNFGFGHFSASLIVLGALSNLLDRILFGCVIDYIDLKFWPASIAMRSIASWPVFNLADVFISIGAIMLIAKLFRKKPDVKKSALSRDNRS